MSSIAQHFEAASLKIQDPIDELEDLKLKYLSSRLPRQTVVARLNALDGKIGALKAVKSSLNPEAYPWSEDQL